MVNHTNKKQANEQQDTMKNNSKLNYKDAQNNFHATALSIYMQYLLQCQLWFEPKNTSQTLLPLSHSDP